MAKSGGASSVGTGTKGSKKLSQLQPGKAAGRNRGRGADTVLSGNRTVDQRVAKVGRGRGIIGGGTPDILGRAPAPASARGNFGGGYAYLNKRRPPNASSRG